MTTVAFKAGIMACDSRYSQTAVGATRGQKIFRKRVGRKEVLIGIAGDVFAAMLFVDWYGTADKDLQKSLVDMTDDGFIALVWDGRKLFEANRYCRLCEVDEPYYAIGSGGVHAITAMDCGKTAVQSIQMAVRRDVYSGGRVQSFTLAGTAPSRPRAA